MSGNHGTLATDRLDSWKEIAAFLGRAERTVKRWESERGLPVHRVPGGGRGVVFAYSHELAEWLKGREEIDGAMAEPEVSEFRPEEAAEEPLTKETHDEDGSRIGRLTVWAVVLLVALSAVLLSLSGHIRAITEKISGGHVGSAEAQDLYLKGRYYWDRRTPDDLAKAIDYFTQAIVKDPGDAQAYVGLADCYNLLREFGAMSPGEAYPRAIAAAQRAVQLDPNSAEAHNSLAFATFWWSWQGATAKREFERALHLNPDLVRAHHWYATYLMAVHQYPEALEQIEQAQRLEPSSTAVLADKGFLYSRWGRSSEGLVLLKQLEKSAPTLSSIHYYLGKIYWAQGDYSGAIEEWRKMAESRHDDSGMALAESRARGLAAQGLYGLLEAELPLEKKSADEGTGSAYDVAVTCGALGKKKEALAYLQLAFDRREAELLTDDPTIPELAGEPEYRALRARVSEKLAE